MSPEERDLAYIWDMLEYANKVVEIIVGQSKHDLHNNTTRRLAIERSLEIIGEAARCPFHKSYASIFGAKHDVK